MFFYKTDPNIYYIGRAKDFHKRFKAPLNINLKDRFHVFANAMGWDKFNFSIIEICELDMHQEKENYSLQKYLPLLNTIFISNMSETQTYDSLWAEHLSILRTYFVVLRSTSYRQAAAEILKLRQSELNLDNKFEGVSIYLYSYINGKLSPNIIHKFTSINKLSQYLGVSRETISIYLNTHVPYRGNLFLTNLVEDIEMSEKLISDITQGLELDRNIAKKVWVYFIEANGAVTKTTGGPVGTVAKALDIHHTSINNPLDKWTTGGLKGNYLFSAALRATRYALRVE
jgi:transposase-like protein